LIGLCTFKFGFVFIENEGLDSFITCSFSSLPNSRQIVKSYSFEIA